MMPDARPALPPELGDLAARLSQLTKEIAGAEQVLAAAAAGRYLDAAAMLGSRSDLLAGLGPSLREAAQLLAATPVQVTIEDAARQIRLHYRETFERALDAAGLARAGQWPSYTIGDVLRLRIDLARGEATLDDTRLPTVEPARLVELAASRLAELLDRPFDPARFLAMLRAAHQTVARAPGRAVGSGEYVDIRSVYTTVRTEMVAADRSAAARDRRYSKAEFAADLYRLARNGQPVTADGLALELSPAPNAASGLYVPMPGGGNFIAAIRFVRYGIHDSGRHSAHPA